MVAVVVVVVVVIVVVVLGSIAKYATRSIAAKRTRFRVRL